MTKDHDILHEYKETVCGFVRISKNLYFSTHFCNVLLQRARVFVLFISCLRRRVGEIREQTHTISCQIDRIRLDVVKTWVGDRQPYYKSFYLRWWLSTPFIWPDNTRGHLGLSIVA